MAFSLLWSWGNILILPSNKPHVLKGLPLLLLQFSNRAPHELVTTACSESGRQCNVDFVFDFPSFKDLPGVEMNRNRFQSVLGEVVLTMVLFASGPLSLCAQVGGGTLPGDVLG